MSRLASYFHKLRYIRAILVLLPLGIILLWLGIDNLSDYPSDVNDLKKVTGRVIQLSYKPVYIKECKCWLESAFMQVQGYKNQIKTREPEKLKALKEYVSLNAEISLWLDSDSYIQQMEVNGNIAIPYERSYFFTYFFIVIGAFITILTIVYIVRHPENIRGE